MFCRASANTAAAQNADAELAVARQNIHYGLAYPSKLILPWVPKEAPDQGR